MDKIVHFEIPVDNVERAEKFYKSCFSWDMESIPDMKYTILRTGPVDEKRMPKEPGFINGGMMQRNKDIKSPILTIAVEDIDKAIETVKKNGGKQVGEKLTVGTMGHAAYFEDTEGNILGLWQSLGEM